MFLGAGKSEVPAEIEMIAAPDFRPLKFLASLERR
jgi:hypothetical protein